MKRGLAALILAVVIGAGAHAQKTADATAAEIHAMEHEWNDAWAYLAGLRSGARTFSGGVGESDVTVRRYGDTAVARGSSTSTVTLNGQPQGGALHFTRVYVKQSGAWKMNVSHATARQP
jgi:hypothetical protein